MKIDIHHQCSDFQSYRAARVKSLFNAEKGCDFLFSCELNIDDPNWKLGVIVGPSGSGKSSLGKKIFGEEFLYNMENDWNVDSPIIDCIAPTGDFNEVTGALASVGLGDVPAWLRPFHVLSNGQKFRAGLARLIVEKPEQVVVDEFTSVVDRQIAKIGAQAFAKAWKRGKGQCVLLSCHYDILDWLEPDWVFDTASGKFARGNLWRRPQFELQIWKTNSSYWKYFKPHYYLNLPMPIAAEYFVGTVENELVCHLAVTPFFTAKSYRATRLVVMPEWQGAGVGTKFLDWVCEYHLQGDGRCGKKFPVRFHTSHPQLCNALRKNSKWNQLGAVLYGGNKKKSIQTIGKSSLRRSKKIGTGFGGHFRAVQSFMYIGNKNKFTQ